LRLTAFRDLVVSVVLIVHALDVVGMNCGEASVHIHLLQALQIVAVSPITDASERVVVDRPGHDLRDGGHRGQSGNPAG
jgi:hypothetical protein